MVEVLLKVEGIDINAKDKDGKTPLDLAKTTEIENLLKIVAKKPDADSVGESLEDNQEDQEKDAEQKGDIQPGREQGISAKEETDVKTEGIGSAASTEPAQTEEQPSSFFGSLFSILMKPFSLIASFFGGFFSWLFGFNEEKADESISQSDDDVSLPTSSSLNNDIYNTMNPSE